MSAVAYDEFDYDDDPGCTLCGGDGYVQCFDPIQCMRHHIGNGWDALCPCGACNGSGLAKDQTVW